MPTQRLSGGEYVTPEDEVKLARSLFLSIVAALVPEVLATLRANLLPVYADTCAGIDSYRLPGVAEAKKAEYRERYSRPIVALCDSGEDPGDWQVFTYASVKAESVSYPDLVPLRKALKAWSNTHHLQALWVRERALQTLKQWHEWPRVFDNLPLAFAGAHGVVWEPVPELERVFRFEHAGWHPTISTRNDAATAIQQAFKCALQGYLDAIEQRLAAADGFKQPKRYTRLVQHFEWLVRYQVMEMTYPDIARLERRSRRQAGAPAAKPTAEDINRAEDRIRKAVPRAANTVDIRLREGDPAGRPPFSPTLETRDHHDTRSRSHRRK